VSGGSAALGVMRTGCPRCGSDVPYDDVVNHIVECFDVQPATVLVVLLVLNPGVGRSRPPTGVRLADGIEFEPEAFRLHVSGRSIDLSPLDVRLLRYLVENKGMVLSRQQILDAVWGYDAAVIDRTVDAHIKSLRRNLDAHPEGRGLIKTVRGQGYRLELP
jgi:DNA-binding response OmpR family regulator